MNVIIIIEGSGQITSIDSQTLDFAKGQTILFPAVFNGIIEFETYTEYLLTTL